MNKKQLTHWGRVTHICVSKLTIIGSDNGLSPSRRQAIVWTNAGSLSIGTLRTYFSEISIKIQQFSLKKMHLKMSSAKRRLCWLGLNVLRDHGPDMVTLSILHGVILHATFDFVPHGMYNFYFNWPLIRNVSCRLRTDAGNVYPPWCMSVMHVGIANP